MIRSFVLSREHLASIETSHFLSLEKADIIKSHPCGQVFHKSSGKNDPLSSTNQCHFFVIGLCPSPDLLWIQDRAQLNCHYARWVRTMGWAAWPPNFSFGREITPNLYHGRKQPPIVGCKKRIWQGWVKISWLAVAVVVSFGQSVKIRVNKLPRIRADESEEGNWTAST